VAKNPVPELAWRGFMVDLAQGFLLPLRSIGLIFATRRLFLLALGSGVVTAVSLIAMAIGFWPLAQDITARLLTGEGFWAKGAEVALTVLLYVTLLVIGALTIPNMLLAPFGDPISEATEAACGGFEAPPFTLAGLLRGALVSVSHTLLRVLLMLGGIAVLWPLSFVPIVGGVVWVVVSWSWSAFWLAVEHLSTPMARHLYPFGAVVRVLRQRSGLALGFGAALVLLLWLPIVNLLLLPLAIVAGTLLFRGLLRIDALPVRRRP
jgi:CysZ protein